MDESDNLFIPKKKNFSRILPSPEKYNETNKLLLLNKDFYD